MLSTSKPWFLKSGPKAKTSTAIFYNKEITTILLFYTLLI